MRNKVRFRTGVKSIRIAILLACFAFCGFALFAGISHFMATKASGEVVNIRVSDTSGGTVKAASGTGYSVSPDNTTTSVAAITFTDLTETPTITAYPATGYSFDGWVSTRGTSTITSPSSTTTTFSAKMDDNILALFKPDGTTRTIKYSNGRAEGETQNYLVIVHEPGDSSAYKAADYITSSNPTATGITFTSYLANDYWFKGWYQVGDGVVSRDQTFVPNVSSLYSDVTYYPVFSNAAHVAYSTNDSSLGRIQFEGWESGMDRCGSSFTRSESLNVEWTEQYAQHFAPNLPYLTIKACPEEGAEFVGWQINGTLNTSLDQQIGMYDNSVTSETGTDNYEVVAVFRSTSAPYEVEIAPNDPSYGSVTLTNSQSDPYTISAGAATGSYVIDANTSDGAMTVDITPTAASGYYFDHFDTTGNVSISGSGNSYTATFSDEGTITAVFVADTYDAIFTTNGQSKGQLRVNNSFADITAVPNSINVPNDTYSNLVMTINCNGDCSAVQRTNSIILSPASGYRFHHFDIVGNAEVRSQTSSGYDFNLTGAATVTAIFGKYVNYTSGTIDGYTIEAIDPSTRQVKTDEDIEGTVTGITIDSNEIPVGASFVGWADENDNIVSNSQTFVPSGSQLDGEPTYHPVFEEVTIHYTSGSANGTTIYPIDIIEGTTKTSESGLGATGVTIDSSLIPSGYRFIGWANENDVIVSSNLEFTPSGASQIYSGATYHPVFDQSLAASFTSSDSNLGLLAYDGWGDKCTNGGTQVATISFNEDSSGLVDFPYNEIKACPIDNNTFVGWSLDGGATIVSSDIAANKWMDWLYFNGSNLIVTAVFAAAPVYTIGVNIPEAGSIDARGGDCADSTKKTNEDWNATLIINGNDKTINTYTSESSVLQACVDNNDYQFDYWQIDNTINASSATTLAKTHSGWPSSAGYHSLRAMFGTPITYLPGIVDADTSKTVTVVDPADGTTTKTSELSTSVTGATFSTSSLANYTNAKFAGWEEVKDGCVTPNCPIVSTDETFIPSGDQLYVGATYRPVFVTDNNYTLVVSNDPDAGYISYWSGSQSAWVGRTDNGEFHVASVNGYVNGGIKATPREDYVFDHWEHNGTTICTASTSGCAEIVANEVQYQAGSGNSLPTLVAYFTPASAKYHVFTGYTGANGYFDHDLPETQRPGGVGAQAGALSLTYYEDTNSDIPAATASFSGDQHSTAPNGYYFAYWITGCNTNYDYTEMVEMYTGHEDEMQALGSETIVSFDYYFRPSREQVQTCGEYIAVFYRKNQIRLIAQSENEAIGVVNATTTSSSELYQELCDGTLMRVKANLGVGVNSNGYYSSCDATSEISNTSYKISSWTFNGYTVLDATTHEPVESLKYRGDYVVEDNGSYVSLSNVIVGDALNYLVAHYELVPLPFTGSATIWIILGGGIGLVAIPSIILIANERKEQKKGGKK